MSITPAGEGTKIVFTGDACQIDTPYLDSRSNGLTCLIDKMNSGEGGAFPPDGTGVGSAVAAGA